METTYVIVLLCIACAAALNLCLAICDAVCDYAWPPDAGPGETAMLNRV